MKKSRFTEEQVAAAVRQAESGVPVVEICRRLGVTEVTFYRWKKRFAGMGVTELRKLRQLEEEQEAEVTGCRSDLGQAHAPGSNRKKAVKPARKRMLVEFLRVAFKLSERHACRLIRLSRSSQRYQHRRDGQVALRIRLKELAAARPRYGYFGAHFTAPGRLANQS